MLFLTPCDPLSRVLLYLGMLLLAGICSLMTFLLDIHLADSANPYPVHFHLNENTVLIVYKQNTPAMYMCTAAFSYDSFWTWRMIPKQTSFCVQFYDQMWFTIGKYSLLFFRERTMRTEWWSHFDGSLSSKIQWLDGICRFDIKSVVVE